MIPVLVDSNILLAIATDVRPGVAGPARDDLPYEACRYGPFSPKLTLIAPPS